MIAALSLTNIYPGFSTGNNVHKYYFGVWTLSGIRMCFVARNKRGGWLSLRWFQNYKLEYTNKELDGRLTSLLLLARFFSSALILLRDRVHLPNVLDHSFACIIIPST
jgi:hypothetical protein